MAVATVEPAGLRRWLHRAGTGLVLFGALYYLQFGLQALFHHVAQGVLTLVGAAGLGWAVVRRVRRRPASPPVLVTTAPLAVLHAAMTIADPGELIFLLGSLPAPVLSAAVLLIERVRRGPPEA